MGLLFYELEEGSLEPHISVLPERRNPGPVCFLFSTPAQDHSCITKLRAGVQRKHTE